jgi:hypothetical protein
MQASAPPAGRPRAARSSRAVSRIERRAEGCGLNTTALRALIPTRALKMAVDVGFVEGITAATTPMGSAISVTRVAGSSRSTPTVRRGRM